MRRSVEAISQWSESSGSSRRTRRGRRVDLLDQQLIERAGQVRGQAQRFGGVAAAVALDQPTHQHQAPRRLDRGGNRGLAERLEHAADPFAEFGIADRNQAGQQQAAGRAAHERVLDRPRRPVVGDEHDSFGEPCLLTPVARDQPARQRVGESAMRGDGEALGLTGESSGGAERGTGFDKPSRTEVAGRGKHRSAGPGELS